MAVSDLRARFDAVPTSGGTAANEVKAILMEAAVKINDLLDDDALATDVTQHLEQALHRAASRLGATEEAETASETSSDQDTTQKRERTKS